MKKTVAVTTFTMTLIFSCLTVAAQTQSREEALKDIEAKRAELVALEKKFLGPSESDREAYATFLEQSNTGITRLLPRETYDSDVYKENRKTLTVRGGGAYFSFTAKSHEYSATTEIGLERGTLQVGFAGANYGMLTTLGDMPLEGVNLEMPAVRILANHNPPTELPQARVEQQRISHGASVEGIVFKRHLPLQLDMTYVLRSINYDASDALVAFRVVRIDTDGSAIIVWKHLRKFPIPQLVRS